MHETEITQIKVGKKIAVQLENDKEKEFTGKITQISWQPTTNDPATPTYYVVWADVDNPDSVLKPGNKVIIHVELADS